MLFKYKSETYPPHLETQSWKQRENSGIYSIYILCHPPSTQLKGMGILNLRTNAFK